MPWNISIPDPEWYAENDERLDGLVRAVLDQPVLAIDTETTGLKVWKDIPLFWSLSWGERRICMPASTLPYFERAFSDSGKRWVFANAKFDMHMLANVGVQFAGECVDTAVMHALLYEEESHALKDMAKQVLGWNWTDFFDTFNPMMVPDMTQEPKKLRSGGLSQPNRRETIQELLLRHYRDNLPKLVDYASNDAYGTMKVYEALLARLENENTFSLYPEWLPNLAALFFETEMPFTKVLWNCERNGIYVDREYLQNLRGPMWAEHEALLREMVQLSGRADFNPNSGEQKRDWFFGYEKLKPLTYTKGGKSGVKVPSVDKAFLEHYEHESPMAGLILRDSKLTKLIGTYIDGVDEHLDPASRIHTRFNQDIARTGRLSSSDPNCFSPDTEVLTPLGWRRFDEYASSCSGTEPIAQWSPGGAIEFVLPTAFIKKTAETLVHLNNQHIRLAVTEDHRCLLRHRKTGELRVFKAADYPEDWQQIHAGRYGGGAQSLGVDLVRLIVAIQADGNVRSSGAVDFGFKKPRKILRLRELIERLNVQYSYNAEGNRGRTRIYLKPGHVVSLALSYLKGPAKSFGPWLLELIEDELDAFCEEIMFWDGSWTRKNSYSSNNRANTTWVQTAFALRGKRAHFRTYAAASGKSNYQVDIVDRDYSMTTNVEKSTRPHNDAVYCVSVPSSYVLVRYSDEIAVTGQCQNIPTPEKDKFQLRGAFKAVPGKTLIVGDYEQLEMRLLAAATRTPEHPAGAVEMIQIFLDGKDIHMGNAAMVFGPIFEKKYGWRLTYDFLKEAKKIDSKVKEGAMPSELRTEKVKLALLARNQIKSVGFGLNYGMKEGKLSRQLGIPKEEAKAIIEAYLKTYPAVQGFYASAIATARLKQRSYTLLGRRRCHPAIESNNSLDRWSEERKAVNNEIQGSAADAVRLAMLQISMSDIEYQYGCKMLLQVHDELLFECPEETAEPALNAIRELMEHPFPNDLLVPLTISIGTGPAWNKAK